MRERFSDHHSFHATSPISRQGRKVFFFFFLLRLYFENLSDWCLLENAHVRALNAAALRNVCIALRHVAFCFLDSLFIAWQYSRQVLNLLGGTGGEEEEENGAIA